MDLLIVYKDGKKKQVFKDNIGTEDIQKMIKQNNKIDYISILSV